MDSTLYSPTVSFPTPSCGSFRLAVLSGRCRLGVTGRIAGSVLATHPSLYVGRMRTPSGTGLYCRACVLKESVVEVDGRLFIVASYILSGGGGGAAVLRLSGPAVPRDWGEGGDGRVASDGDDEARALQYL